MLESHVIAVVTYLLVGSVVLFFEVIFPYGFLGFIALAFYGIAVFKAWLHFGWIGVLAAVLSALLLGLVTAYWELRMIPRKKRLRDWPENNR